MEVTVEPGDGQALTDVVGQTGTVLKVVGCFAILRIGDDVRGCLTMYCQPKVTAAALAARFEQQR
jgi:hypothetical protein